MTQASNGSDNRKKWLIGCSGCLIVLVLLVVGIIALGKLGFDYVKQASDSTTQELLGKNYKPPANYTTLGLPMGQKDFQRLIVMMNAQNGTMLMVVDTDISPETEKMLKQGDPKQFAALIEQVGRKATSGAEKSNTSLDMKDFRIDKVRTIQLESGKTFPLCTAKAYDKKKGIYRPVAIALLPQSTKRLVAIIGLDPRNTSSDPEAKFQMAYGNLEQELLKLIRESELDDRLL
ncbi:MAG TPA: hypothetical protein V6C99_12565 [Oculatellaceae cyanobacterium]|jgi:hypothetical protein